MRVNTLIVGGGPAGISSGIYLAMEGVDTLIFPRDELCEGLLTSKGLDRLTELGIDTTLPDFYRPDSIRLYSGDLKIFEYSSKEVHATVNGEFLGNAMLNMYENLGGKVLLGDNVVQIDITNKYVITGSGMQIHYENLVGACSEVYESINEGVALFSEEVHSKDSVDIMLNKYNSKLAKTRRTDSVFLIGDAAGYVDPVFGGRLSYDILSGDKVAKVILSSDKEKEYDIQFSDYEKMVTYGKVLQTLLLNKYIRNTTLKLIAMEPKLIEDLCDSVAISNRLNCFNIWGVIKVMLISLCE